MTTTGFKAALADVSFLMHAVRRARPVHADAAVPEVPDDRYIELPGRGRGLVRIVPGPEHAIPVVLLHAWTWNADLTFADAYRSLSWHHQVIAPDLRHHARGIRGSGPLQVQDATDDVIALLDVLGIERALLAGYSLGGILCVDAALRYPGRVAGIVVGSAAACYTSLARDRAVFAALRTARPLAPITGSLQLTARYFHQTLQRSPELATRWQWVRAELARTSPVDAAVVGDAVSRVDLRSDLAGGIACPAEFLLLTRDRVCRPTLQYQLATLLGAHVVRVDADHDLPIADPQEFTRLLTDALRRLATSRTNG